MWGWFTPGTESGVNGRWEMWLSSSQNQQPLLIEQILTVLGFKEQNKLKNTPELSRKILQRDAKVLK